jgi:hypothetical protein
MTSSAPSARWAAKQSARRATWQRITGEAARSLTLVTSEAVRAGEIGGNALQKILTIGGDMAGMFGVGGAVVGALAITGLAIVSYFDRAKKQIEEAANTARVELRSLRDMSARDAATTLSRAVSGDPLAVTKDNKVDRYGELSKAQLEETSARLARGQSIGVDVRTQNETEYGITLEGVNKELKERIDLIQRATPLVQAAAEIEARRTIEEGKAGLVAKAATEEQQRTNNALGLAKEAGDSALLSVSRLLAAQDAAAKTRESYGIRAPGDISNLAGDIASGGTAALLGQLQKDHPFDINAYFEQLNAAAQNEGLTAGRNKVLGEMADKIKGAINHTLGDAINAGFQAAFSGKGLGGIFKAFGKTVLSHIGSMIVEQGQTYLKFGAILQPLVPHLFNPITSAWASTAIGVALIGLGSALGALGSGGGGGGGGFAAVPRPAEITNLKLVATGVADAARIAPRGAVNMTVIGPGDPAAFRQIQQGLDNHARR